MDDSKRIYDVVVYGATGFTGGLVAEYLARHAGDGVTWAVAGRSASKLGAVVDHLKTIDPELDVGVIEADSRNAASLQIMALKTKVVLTTVGPYIDWGEPLVRAAILGGADYVDITGEPEFVDAMVHSYGEMARERGVRIVHCCGFDSIPHDLGVYRTVSKLPEGEPITVEGFVRAQGSPSGGTWRSAIKAMARFRDYQEQRAERKADRAAADGERHVRGLSPSVRYDRALGAWVFPLPTIDPQVVLRSARGLDRYGPDFRYGHYGATKKLSLLVGGAAAVAGMFALAQLGPTRNWLLSRKQSGDGPSEEQRERGWFECTYVGRAGDAEATTRVSGGDPGYAETAKMVAESALCLALDRDRLPRRAGNLTTAEAMGDVLIERLERRGIRFDVLGS